MKTNCFIIACLWTSSRSVRFIRPEQGTQEPNLEQDTHNDILFAPVPSELEEKDVQSKASLLLQADEIHARLFDEVSRRGGTVPDDKAPESNHTEKSATTHAKGRACIPGEDMKSCTQCLEKLSDDDYGIREVFGCVDRDEDGFITLKEFGQQLQLDGKTLDMVRDDLLPDCKKKLKDCGNERDDVINIIEYACLVMTIAGYTCNDFDDALNMING